MSDGSVLDRRPVLGSRASAPVTETRIGVRCHAALPWLAVTPGTSVQVAIDPRLTRVPHTAPWFRGVMNLRGNLYPLFDLATWAGAPPADASHLVLLEAEAVCAGFVASDVPRLLEGPRLTGATPEVGAWVPFVSAAFRHESGVLFEFDFRRWLAEIGHHVVHTAE